MKLIILIAGLFICFATTLFSQENAEKEAVKLPDPVMEQVVKRIVTWYFKVPKKSKTIYFAAETIKKEWLPKINNIDFVVLEARNPSFYEDEYQRKVYFFHEVERSAKHFTIDFGYGLPNCDADGDTWAFRVSDSRIRLWKQTFVGWKGGCSSPSFAV